MRIQGCQYSRFHYFFTTGVVKSPKFPDNYPPNLQKTNIIKVEEGMIVLLQFHVFNIEFSSNCEEDSLKIVDGDGTALLPKSCGSFLPKAITSTSNIIELHFSTNLWNARPGWNISWVEVIPGKSLRLFLYLNIFNVDSGALALKSLKI